MGNWIRFFIGTPRRSIVTASVMAGIFFLLFPSVLRKLLVGFMREICPLLSPLFQITVIVLIIVFTIRVIFRGGRRENKRR